MRIKEILDGAKFETDEDLSEVDVVCVTDDSRAVGRGDMFIAVKGHMSDGRKFIDEAMARGAMVIVTEKRFTAPKGISVITMADTRSALPLIFDNFYGHPSQKLKVIGITGTNGKTTITYIIERILKCAGHDAGVIGTINWRLKDKVMAARNTTPGVRELQTMLYEMVKSGIKYAVMEVSSHSLDQDRVGRVGFDAAIFTNVTSDHLDYHKTRVNYFNAKKRIFNNMKEGGVAILNIDDEKVAGLRKSLKCKTVTYGINDKADVRAREIRLSPEGTRFIAMTPAGQIDIRTKLIGMHNVSNILASIAACHSLGMGADAIRRGVGEASLVPGRLEPVEAGQPFKVFVDYAHTEDALNNVLGILKKIAKGRIITVFGCGGDRDKKKRPLMGITACRYSDHVIITSDNPRFEEPGGIIRDIEKGVKGKFCNYDIVADRRGAIERALAFASDGDIVLIAGKGHEDYQIVGGKVLPFDDREAAREAIRKRYEGKRDIKDNRRAALIG